VELPARIGKYAVERLLGEGGFGRVYLARHPELGVTVAVKLLHRPMAGDLHEAVLQARLDHPGIVRVLDADRADERAFIVMEYLPGGSLEERLASGALEAEAVLRLGRELAAALAHAHARGVVHRDLKPANVLFDARGRAKVADFGLARLVGEGVHHTRLAGTVAYLSPEQLQGRVSPASDLWALGCILHQALAGAPPFTGAGDYGVMRAIAEQPAPSLTGVAGVPEGLARLVTALLAKDPRARPSAREVAAVLESLSHRTHLLQGGGGATQEWRDWVCFRGGPGRSGCLGPLPAPPWEAAWRRELGAPVFSSPALCGGRVFLGGNDGTLWALELATGEELWRVEGETTAYPSPVAAATVVAAAWGGGEVRALAAENGRELWRAELDTELVASPLLVPGRGLFVADTRGVVYHLAGEDGRVLGRWSSPTGAAVEGAPLWTGEGVVCADMAGGVLAVAPGEERPRWQVRLQGAVEASPAAWGQALLLLEQGGRLWCLEADTGRRRWHLDLGGLAVATPAVEGDQAVVATLGGEVYLVDLARAEVLWRRELPTGVSASPCLQGAWVVVADREGVVRALSREDGEERGSLERGAPIHSSPAAAAGFVVTATSDGEAVALRGQG
jgi:outer membrane protein assembly factor BamB/predicted Ser/Thr protein kinase